MIVTKLYKFCFKKNLQACHWSKFISAILSLAAYSDIGKIRQIMHTLDGYKGTRSRDRIQLLCQKIIDLGSTGFRTFNYGPLQRIFIFQIPRVK
jgi:hypothetical protein